MSPELLCLLMFIVTCGLLLTGFPVAFVLAGSSLICAGLGSFMGIFDWALMSAFPQRVFGIMNSEVLLAVPLFVFMGVMMERSKIAEDLLENMGRAFGSFPGGLGYAVCIVGALLAASTGIVGATVVTMGLISLPVMLRQNYCPRLSCGAIAASGTLGQIIPPSIVLILLGDQLSTAYQQAQFKLGNFSPDTVSVNDLFAGALVPGLVLVGMYLLYLLITAKIFPSKMPALSTRKTTKGSARKLTSQLWQSLIAPVGLIIAVLGSILTGLATPTEAAAVGAVGATLLSGLRLAGEKKNLLLSSIVCFLALLLLAQFFDLRMGKAEVSIANAIAFVIACALTFIVLFGILVSVLICATEVDQQGDKILFSTMRSTMLVTSMVFIILVGASMFSLVFRGLGGDEYIEAFLQHLPGGTVGALLMVMLVIFILGFFLDFLEIIFIVVPIVAPILLQMEITDGVLMSPVWLGVMIALNLQTSFLTPPFGFALFYLRGVAPSSIKTIDIYKGVFPFVGLQLLALVLLWLLPDMATWLPSQIYN